MKSRKNFYMYIEVYIVQRARRMSSDRRFWIMIRIAVVELIIIFALLRYILQLKSLIRPISAVSSAGMFSAIAVLLLSIVKKKYTNNHL